MSSPYKPSPKKFDFHFTFGSASNHSGIRTLFNDGELEIRDFEALRSAPFEVMAEKYLMEPIHVRNQTGRYGEAFTKHELYYLENDESNFEKMSNWKTALTRAANRGGWGTCTYEIEGECQHIKNIVNDAFQQLPTYECQHIGSIVNDVFRKLSMKCSNEIQGLVAVDEHYKKIESLLKKFQVIGIWGMGGMGKTTLAKVTFAKLSSQYDSACFLANVREETKRHGVTYLRDKLIFHLLPGEISMSDFEGSTSISMRLKRRKVFVVIDDVDNLQQVECLFAVCGDLGPHSRVIITTRSRQLLTERVEKVYEVKKWGYQESVELFSLHAFKKSQCQKGYEDLLERAISYAGGVPLALIVLGRYLRSKSLEFWDSELAKLKRCPNEEIQNVLQVSYDELQEQEKTVFLDVAFFFKDEYKDRVIRILNACGFNGTSGIDVLENKALITISNNNRIQMHDLLEEMALDVVRKEFRSEPGRRSRLRDFDEVSDVLKNEKGTDAVEGMTLDLSQIEDLQLSSDAFKVMPNLRFIKLYIPLGMKSGNVHIPRDLKPFSEKLRYLEWNGYPSESLPQNFCAKLLVEIRMPQSHITELWPGEQDLVNLEGIDLSEGKQLIKLPDLSRALKLRWVNLSGCESLCDLHPSILSLNTLVTLILDGCKSLKSLKSDEHLSSLQKISVNGCTSLKQFSVSSDLIVRLDLSSAGIEILHSSIGRLRNLRWLNLEGLRLKKLPDELSLLKYLRELRISSDCYLVIHKKKLHMLFDGLRCLQILYLKDCCYLSELPDNVSVLSRLRELRLDGSGVERLPASIKHLQQLEVLSLENCWKLQCLPELPPCILKLHASNCMSLVTVSTLKSFALQMKGKEKFVSFMNDMKLNAHSMQCIVEDALLTMMSAAFHNVLVRRYTLNSHRLNYDTIKVCLPGSRVPEQFTYRTRGSSMTIDLPSGKHLLGFMLFAVLSPSLEMKNHGAKIFCQCSLAYGRKVGYATTWYHAVTELNADHVFAWYDPFLCDSVLRNYNRQLSFEFYVTNDKGERDGLNMATKECGVRLIFDSEFRKFLLDLDCDLQSKLELGLELGSELGLEFGSKLLSELESQHKTT